MKNIFRKLIAAALCATLLLAVVPLAASAAAVSDYAASKQYQGMGFDTRNTRRNEDFLVLYDDTFDPVNSEDWNYFQPYYIEGLHTTCSNPYGYEVVVNQFGYVTAIGGNNQEIPSGGYVVSGHGAKAAELRENVAVGDLLNVNAYPALNVYRVTDDDKRASYGNTDTLSMPYTALAGGSYAEAITVGGNGVTTGSTVWQNDLLVKVTGVGADPAYAGVGYVVAVGGNNIAVPSGYFAVTVSGSTRSDNGSVPYNGAQFITEYMSIGTLVNLGTNAMYVRHNADAAVRAAKLLTGLTDSTLTLPVGAVEDCAISNDISQAKSTFKLVDTNAMDTVYADMMSLASNVTASDAALGQKLAGIYRDYQQIDRLNMEKKTVEFRATWVRPFNAGEVDGKTAAQLDAMVEASVDEVVGNGYNMLFLETFYNSCTIMPMKGAGYNGLSYRQNPHLTAAGNPNLTADYDMLRKYIEVCHRHGVELHLWMEVFYVGYQRTNGMTDSLFPYSVATDIMNDPVRYAGWLNTASNGDLYFGAETDSALQYFLNPANDGVRQFLFNSYRYIWDNYDIDGFQLDYIRYARTQGNKCFGYDSDTIAAFKAAYPAYAGTDMTQPSFFFNSDWVAFRAAYVTSFVGAIHQLIGQNRPDIYLTAATGSEYDDALNGLMQDLKTWFRNGYIDILFPMSYGENVVEATTAPLVQGNSERFVCVGVSGSYVYEPMELKWMRQIREAGADGIGAFTMITSYYSAGLFTEPAVTPTGNASVAALTYLRDTVRARVLKMRNDGAINAAQQFNVDMACNTAESLIRCTGIDNAAAALTTLQSAINNLQSVTAKAALNKDMAFLQKIKNNSHDAASQEHDITGDIGLRVNGVDIAGAGSDFTYVSSTGTLTITEDHAVVSGTANRPVSILLTDDVTTLTLNDAVFTAALNDYPALDMLDGSVPTLRLMGRSTVTANTVLAAEPTYIGTGSLWNGDTLVFCKGDMDGNGILTTSDCRMLLLLVVSINTPTWEQQQVGDANGDGKVNSSDVHDFLLATVQIR